MGSFFPAKSTAILLAAMVVLALGIAYSYDRASALLESNAMVVHTYRVIGKIHEVDAAMHEAEARQRAYLIAGQEKYLEAYHVVSAQIPQTIDQLKEMASDNAAQLKSVLELQKTTRARIDLLEQHIRLRRTGGAAALTQIEFESGRQLMEEISGIVDRMVHVEEYLLAVRNDVNNASARVLYATLLATGVSAAVMTVLALVVFRREAMTWEQFRVTLASIGDGVIVTDDAGRVTYMNSIAEDLTEWILSDAVGRKLPDVFNIINEETRERIEKPVEKAIREGSIVGLTNHTILLSRGGKERYIEDSAAPIRAEGFKLAGVVLVFRNIEERRRSEKQLQELNSTLEARVAERSAVAQRRAAQLQALALELTHAEQRERRRLAHVLHDHLQQLLVAVKMRLAILQGRFKLPDTDADIHEVTELLDQSIEASRSLSVELSPPVLFNSGFVAGVQWLAQWMKEKHQLHVIVTADADVDPLEEDSRAFLFQSVRELLFNVVKHSGVLSAEVSIVVEVPDQLRICVLDHGKGFAQTSSDSRDAGVKPGFGMLGISERLAMMAGAMEVTSAPGEGTKATLTIQIRRPASNEGGTAQQIDPTAGQEGDQTERRDTIRVLLADDHQIFREGLASVLASQPGIEVVGQACNGWEAVEMARSLRPHVVTMDIAMPGLAGIEAAAIIVRELQDVKVIALSMHAEAEYSTVMRRAGAVVYLRKDAPAAELVGVILDCCERGPAPDLVSPVV